MLGRHHSLSPASKTVFNLEGWLKDRAKIAWAEPISSHDAWLRVQVEIAQHIFKELGGGG